MNSRILRGKNNCKKINLSIVGIARNVEKYLENNIKNLLTLRESFNQVKFFIYENDSVDDTVKILEKYKNNGFEFQSEKLNNKEPVLEGKHAKNRFIKMSQARNKYVSWIRKNPTHPECGLDYILVLDWDIKHIDLNGIYSCFTYIDSLQGGTKWDVMTANGIDDVLFKFPFWSEHHYYDPLAFEDIKGYRVKGHSCYPTEKYTKRPDYNPYIPEKVRINSGFSGVAIYKRELFSDNDYSPTSFIDCEHIVFHNKLKDKRIFLNTELLLYR